MENQFEFDLFVPKWANLVHIIHAKEETLLPIREVNIKYKIYDGCYLIHTHTHTYTLNSDPHAYVFHHFPGILRVVDEFCRSRFKIPCQSTRSLFF